MIGSGMTSLKRLVSDPLHLAAGGFVQSFGASHGGWSWVLTLTMRHDVPDQRVGQAVRFYARGLAVDLGLHFPFAFTTERRDGTRGAHGHALLGGGLQGIGRRELEHRWRASDPAAGFTRINRYTPAIGAGLGASLYLTKEHDRWGVGVVCPRTGDCAHRRCVEGPAPF